CSRRLMRVVVVAVGKVKDRPLRAAIDDYLGRVRRYTPCDEIELADAPAPRLEPAFARATAEATTVALEVGGRALDSPAFARGPGRAGHPPPGAAPPSGGGVPPPSPRPPPAGPTPAGPSRR